MWIMKSNCITAHPPVPTQLVSNYNLNYYKISLQIKIKYVIFFIVQIIMITIKNLIYKINIHDNKKP